VDALSRHYRRCPSRHVQIRVFKQDTVSDLLMKLQNEIIVSSTLSRVGNASSPSCISSCFLNIEYSDKLFIFCTAYKINLLITNKKALLFSIKRSTRRFMHFVTYFNMKNNLETLALLGKETSQVERKDIF